MVTDTQILTDYDERIHDVQKYVREHTDEELNREVLAAVAGFSVPHFHRIFTAHVGENIASYVRRVRLERAGRKLRMGAVDITEVALAAGYDTHAAFSKAFKQHFGLSPSEFRQLDCRSATQILLKGK
jgi:AraC family transcriptional regulator